MEKPAFNLIWQTGISLHGLPQFEEDMVPMEIMSKKLTRLNWHDRQLK